jgi:hypothetical protein
MKAVALITSALVFIGGCSKHDTASTNQQPQQLESKAPDPEPPKKEFVTLIEAIEGIKPMMSDTQDGISPGTAMLAFWSAERMNWKDLQATPKTKYALIMKDSEEQRGKAICATGRIIEIASEKAEGKKFYNGGLYDEAGRIYRFIAVRSTGDLVAQSFATICGVVTGRQSYRNSVGGVAHAIFLVGMFDLPENKN